MRGGQTNGDRTFNLSKWHQGLQPTCLIILKLNLGQRMTQTCVFIKLCLDHLFSQSIHCSAHVYAAQPFLLVVACFMIL